MKKELLKNEIEKLNGKYENLMNEINLEKAQGNLSKLYNLNTSFDETFDQFFDDLELRKKYNDYDFEENCIIFDKTSVNLLEEFDEEDLKRYIEFYNNYISQLEDELNELKRKEEY